MRRLAEGTNTALLVGILALLLAVVNVAAGRWFVRADLTENKEYTISPATRRVVAGLSDIVNVKVYFSKNLPPYLLSMQRRTVDLIEEMRAYAGDNLRFEVTDPASDPKLEAKVRGLGIPQIQLQVIEKDKASVRNAYLGMAIQYEDRTEVIPVVRPEGLEYDVVSALLKVVRNEEKTIGVLTSGDRSLQKGFARANEFLSREYALREIRTGTGEPIGSDVTTLLVAGPLDLSERDAFEIDQFVMRGGKAIVCVDAVREPIQVLSGFGNPIAAVSGLDSVLASFGLRARREMVVDGASPGMIAYITTVGMIQLQTTRPYPPFIKLTSKTLSRTNPAVSQLEGIVLPWAAPLEVVEPLPAGVAVDTLGRTSDKTWVQAGRFTLSPQSRWDPPDPSMQKSFPVCVAATGRFRSAFAGRAVPPLPGDTLTAASGDGTVLVESPETQVVLLGSSYAFDDNMLGQYPENATFLLNLVDWLSLGDELIGIRSRAVTDRPIAETSDRARAAIRLAGMFGSPLLVVMFGLGRALSRRRAKRAALGTTP
jgi:gliding-associated putative ABC transporter substrate-binding component GldG